MPGTRGTSSRLQRLDELKGLLASREHITIAALAAALAVSLRTLKRDLALLRESGMPIESARGRGGGLRLHRHWSVGRVSLDYREAIDALLSLAVAEKLGSSLFLERIRTTRNKLAATFAPSHRDRIRSLRRRILIGAAATAGVMSSYDAQQGIRRGNVTQAFFELRRLRITYLDGHGRRTVRDVEPQFLYLSWPLWYLLAWDELRQGVRTFRIDRIVESHIQAEGFRLRDERPFLRAIEEAGNRL